MSGGSGQNLQVTNPWFDNATDGFCGLSWGRVGHDVLRFQVQEFEIKQLKTEWHCHL
jgi:hypothetical protein